MKNFLVFCGELQYPLGGWRDRKADFDTEAEAVAFCQRYLTAETERWAQVVDLAADRMVFNEVL